MPQKPLHALKPPEQQLKPPEQILLKSEHVLKPSEQMPQKPLHAMKPPEQMQLKPEHALRTLVWLQQVYNKCNSMNLKSCSHFTGSLNEDGGTNRA